MRTESPDVAVLIPCKDEQATIGKVIDDFRRELPDARIVVIDNCSVDDTADIAADRGATVHEVIADFQDWTNGSNGYLRIMTFYPADNEIAVQTYSPVIDTYQTDADSEFTLPFDMGGIPFTLLGTASAVESGDNATYEWSGLAAETTYEWYVEVMATGGETKTSPVWEFTTAPSS